jgi:hypothetical protein
MTYVKISFTNPQKYFPTPRFSYIAGEVGLNRLYATPPLSREPFAARIDEREGEQDAIQFEI